MKMNINTQIMTPQIIVDEMLNMLDPKCFYDDNYVFLEPSCGDGIFITSIYSRMPKNREPSYYIDRVYACDIDPSMIEKTKKRILNYFNINNHPLIKERILCKNFLK